MNSELFKAVAIVDDDPFLLESLRDFFDAMGIRNRIYRSADIFLQSGELDLAHCVLADLKMPGTSGIELLEIIVKRGGPPVCIMTSFSDARTRIAAKASGAAAFVEKPINSADLLAFIDGCYAR
ncbi:response regulator [Agrobacterium radiobacter]|jgi:FixJ family two-component response regulator|uniref:response regulator n=1 Tax=Agrobacterium radiobacter TaxID=362 RepID=UPI0007618FF9|nr:MULTISPECIES: response regulator [Agrobacterium tumefaciens complex]KAB0456404.1 response regulator [Agrobacterium tumefaciens]KWT79405.1 regulator [Agrobacterium radiobacter]MBB4408696.1 two-component system response regulator FixJ [Agrobacterium radiobacter]MBB4454391.1 two-component system response regulator FixJ [Agrobacterium radiobacter]NIB12675.1 response regulator [Agrobacterium radiobacter]